MILFICLTQLNGLKYCYLTLIILFIKYSYQIQTCTQLYGFKSLIIIIPSKKLNISIWALDRTLIGTTTVGQSWPEINGNEGVLYIPQSSGNRA